MMGRAAPRKILTTDQPELPKNIQLLLESDALRLTSNPRQLSFVRGYAVDEALPYMLPEGTLVIVSRKGRQFIANERPTLVIAEPEQPKQAKKKRHDVYSVAQVQASRALARKAKHHDKPIIGDSATEPQTTER